MTDDDSSVQPENLPAAPSPASEPPKPKRRVRVWVWTTAFVVPATGAGMGAGLGWRALALESTTEASQQLSAVSERVSDVTDQRGMALDKAHASVSSLAAFTGHPRPDYLSDATANSLAAADARLTTASKNLAQETYDAPKIPAVGADLLPWTVLADVQHTQALARQEDALRRKRAAELAALVSAQKAVTTSYAAVYRELAAHGEQVLTADASATYESKIPLRHAIDDGKSDVTHEQSNGTQLVQIMASIDGVNTAQAAGEAAKQDPAYPIRAQVEEYARSIAHGVPLDFEWHKEVSGLGDGWYSGTTMYRFDDGGWATIDLNFSIQEGWTDGDVDAKALVTHEVGHAQVVRPECRTLFDGPAFRQDDEMWATAWAISMGFDTGGSGIEAYGRPSDEQIAVAGQCR